MSWADDFVANLPNAKMSVTANGRPFISMGIDKNEFVEIKLTESIFELPFEVSFKRLNDSGQVVEQRPFGYASTKLLAQKLARDVALLRQNSREFVFDGE